MNTKPTAADPETVTAGACTPEPWRAFPVDPEEYSGMEAWGSAFAITSGEPDTVHELYVGFCLKEKEAARIVACVNACAGINPEAVPKLLRLAELLSRIQPNEGITCEDLSAFHATAVLTLAKAKEAQP